MSDEEWEQQRGNTRANGVIFRRSTVSLGDIQDGTTATYLIGERYISPDNYTTGKDATDDQCMYSGHDRDVIRYTVERPEPDRPGWAAQFIFGSPHSSAWNVAMCDGSVQAISYEISATVHLYLGSRADGEVVAESEWQ
jgi:prepilin-type processing-associated H-X9-DG protein